MDGWTNPQRAFAVKAYYETHSYAAAQRLFRTQFAIHRNRPVPTPHAIKLWVANFEATASTNRRRGGGRRTARTPENIERVRVAVGRSPRRSARRHSVALQLSDRTVRRVLKLDLHNHPYKLQVVQTLNENDIAARRRFCERFLVMIEENQDIVHNFWMSDEAHFHLSGYVNKQNFRYWSDTNPRQLHQQPLHSSKVTVWCAMSSLGIIGPFFFENEHGETVTVNAERYSEMLRTFFFPQLPQYGMNDETIFQQDGATSHTARVSMHLLNDVFPNRLISRNGAIPWPARSPDLSACDFFLWGYLKSKVFEQRPNTLDELKRNIRREIARIPQQMLRDVMNSFHRRLDECLLREGRHLADVIFKN